MKNRILALILAVLLIPAVALGIEAGPTLFSIYKRTPQYQDVLNPIFYDLQWNGNVAADQTFPDGYVIDSPSEGMANPTGALTVTDTAAGTVKVVSNKLEITGSGSANETGVFKTDGVSRSTGKALLLTHTAKTGITGTYFGWDDAAGITNVTFLGIRGNGTEYWVTPDAPAQPSANVADVVNGIDYQVLMLLGGYNASGIPIKTGDTIADFPRGIDYFIKGGSFSTYTRIWKAPSDNTATLYPMFQIKQAEPVLFDNILIPTNVLNVDTMFQPAYHDATPDLNVNDITIADAIIDTNVTFPAGAATFQIRFRYQDSENFWNVKCLSGTAGTDLTLHKTTATVEGAAVASADVDFTAAAHDIRIIVDGSTWFRVYVDGVLKLTYNGPDTAFEAETEVQLVDAGAAFTENTFTAHYRTNRSWDAEISAATGGGY